MTLRNSFLCLALTAASFAQSKPAAPSVCESCMKAEIEYMASDALRGRGSATKDELTAAQHIADVFQKLGLEPVHDNQFILPATLEQLEFTAPPKLQATIAGKPVVLTMGKDILANRFATPQIRGKLYRAKPDSAVQSVPEGSIVLLDMTDAKTNTGKATVGAFLESKASAILLNDPSSWKANRERFSKKLPRLPSSIHGEATRSRMTLIGISPEATSILQRAEDGTEITIGAPTVSDPLKTRNVVAVLRGSDPKLKDQYVMFSAHMDHLGVCATSGDKICNGADDDASGTATVMELARIFSKGDRPKRSILFVTFGSEELGLIGSRAFAANPPVPLNSIVADIEFEQTGLPEKDMDGHFWMTGSQLSDLKDEFSKHGGTIGDDPYPGNPYFRQSDNYSLAAKGVVAHTVSGAAEFPDYHKPGDEANKLNYDFLAKALEQALPGFEWLVNTDEVPKYLPGKNPAEHH